MAFSKKPAPVVVFVVLMLLVTQPAYSKKRKSGLSRICKAKCYMTCLGRIVKHGHFGACVAACYLITCGSRAKTLYHPSFQCGVGCIKSECSNPGDGNGKVNKECVTSCLNNCNGKFIGDRY